MTGTRRTLLRLHVALLAATAVTLVGGVVAIDLSRREAQAVRAGLAPAREGAAAARESYLTADAETIERFTGPAPDGGPDAADPGEAFWTAIAGAGRQLTLVSQAEVDGRVTEKVQVLNGMQSTYQRLVQQAFRARADTPRPSVLAQAYLQYAHRFLNEEILAQLTALTKDITDTAPGRPPRQRHLLWAVPLAVLAVLLAGTQVWLSRRFRRTLSAPLLAATLLAAALGGTAVLSLAADDGSAASRDRLDVLAGDYQTRAAAAQANACPELQEISKPWHTAIVGACPAPPAGVSNRQLLATANAVSTTAEAAATRAARTTTGVVVAALLIALAVTLGLLPRFEEYRFRRR